MYKPKYTVRVQYRNTDGKISNVEIHKDDLKDWNDYCRYLGGIPTVFEYMSFVYQTEKLKYINSIIEEDEKT